MCLVTSSVTHMHASNLIAGVVCIYSYQLSRPLEGLHNKGGYVILYISPSTVPSPVVNLMLMMTNLSSLTATWDAPLMPNGNLTYTTTLSYTDLATDIIETVLTQQTTEDDRSVTYNSMTSLEPYARYDVVVIASTSVGDSDAATASVVTAQGGM